MNDRLMTVPEVAQITRLPEATLRWFRHEGTKGPRSAKLGRRIVYRESEVLKWIDDQFTVDGARASA